MTQQPVFRADLYRGTAADYDRFRLTYPAELVDHLCRRVGASGGGRLLDLACGPGTATFSLAPRFAEVWAIDLEPGAIELAQHKAESLGVANIRWMTGRAEDVDPGAAFDLVTIGTAFHRLDRPRVAALARGWLRDGGHLALLWSPTPMQGTKPWQREMSAIVVDWMARLDAADRLPPTFTEHLAQHPHTTVLEEAGFDVLGRHEVAHAHDWTVETLIGFLHSTSILPRAVVAARAEDFEDDVRQRLLALEPSGTFREEATFAYDLAAPA